ncbi:glutathione S-transferase N-terminal domain-containing protein [Pseudomonas sp. CVAP|uniref:glutathione S-transferase N-terminal domain-containing protein n=1 Tax=Pseudomonas sp. CVAP\|nr:glutathione S-transferase N-terminal domain-containing protein [Pseudomonas sp. CVAP\
MNPKIELYGAHTGNSLRAAIALEEAGIPYAARKLNLQANEQRDLSYLALNPAGKVPTLVDPTSTPPLIINQSNAIIQFADAKAPGRLAPAHRGPQRDRLDRAVLPRLSRWFDAIEARPAVQRGLKAFQDH